MVDVEEKTVHRFEIVQMDDHFAYLAVHYARNRDWFGYFDDLDEAYEINFHNLSDDKTCEKVTDQVVLDLVGNSTAQGERKAFGLCDPISLVAEEPGTEAELVALCSIVTNSGLWIVGDKDLNPKHHSLSWLAANVDEILAYPLGSTSYSAADLIKAIAMRIHRKDTISIKVLDPTRSEIKQIHDHARNAEKCKWIAITPALLDIYMSSRIEGEADLELGVLFSLGDTEEYRASISTALVVNNNVINTHTEMCKRMMRAIQRSVFHVLCEYEEVIEFATPMYLGEGEACKNAVADALSKMIGAEIFPTRLPIRRAEWHASGRAYLLTRTMAEMDYRYDEQAVQEQGGTSKNRNVSPISVDRYDVFQKMNDDVREKIELAYGRHVTGWLPSVTESTRKEIMRLSTGISTLYSKSGSAESESLTHETETVSQFPNRRILFYIVALIALAAASYFRKPESEVLGIFFAAALIVTAVVGDIGSRGRHHGHRFYILLGTTTAAMILLFCSAWNQQSPDLNLEQDVFLVVFGSLFVLNAGVAFKKDAFLDGWLERHQANRRAKRNSKSSKS